MHKILLLAADTVFILRGPENPLKALQVVLANVSSVSGYKINESKSTLLDLNVGEDVRNQILYWVVTPWKRRIKYLGINIGVPMDLTLLR